jgi:Caspase domain
MLLRLSLILTCLCIAILPAEAKRVALVVGNSNYKSFNVLPNPVNDARLMEKALRDADFEVTLILDADQAQMKRAILDFGRTLRKGVDASLFFYAGHGVQVKGENYLIPIDADLQSEDEVGVQTIDVNAFLETMESAKSPFNIIVLDACRNNPLSAHRGSGGGLAPVTAPKGSFVAYSTAPGKVALDGDGIADSPYTLALAQTLVVPGIKLEDVFKKTRELVLASTGGEQVPFESTNITGDFYFRDANLIVPAAPPSGRNASSNGSESLIEKNVSSSEIESYILNEYLNVPLDDPSARIASRYLPIIFYYGKKASREKVIQDKLKWYSRWYSGSLDMIPHTLRIVSGDNDNYDAIFDAAYEWIGKDSGPDRGKVLVGKVRVYLGLKILNGKLHVFSENSEVIN